MVLNKVRKHVENNFDYVGDKFADEARSMHYGEKEEREIYGETTLEEIFIHVTGVGLSHEK